MAALVVGLGAGERVDPVVLGMAAVAFTQCHSIRCGAEASSSSCHSSAFLTGFLSDVRQPFCAPVVDPAGDSVADDRWLSVCSLTRHGRFSASSPLIAAISSIRLLVVKRFAARQLLLLVAQAEQRCPAAGARDCRGMRRR